MSLTQVVGLVLLIAAFVGALLWLDRTEWPWLWKAPKQPVSPSNVVHLREAKERRRYQAAMNVSAVRDSKGAA